VESDVGSLSGAVQSGDALRLLASLVPVIIEEGRTLEAEKALDVLLQRFPQMPDLYYLRARLLVRQESWLAAAEALERAVALKPDFAQAFRQLAAVYARLGRRQEAQEALQRFRELEP
jgi:uncharacterized protein HemY